MAMSPLPASMRPAGKTPALFVSQMLPLFCEAFAFTIAVASTAIACPAAPISPLPATRLMVAPSTSEFPPVSVMAPF